MASGPGRTRTIGRPWGRFDRRRLQNVVLSIARTSHYRVGMESERIHRLPMRGVASRRKPRRAGWPGSDSRGRRFRDRRTPLPEAQARSSHRTKTRLTPSAAWPVCEPRILPQGCRENIPPIPELDLADWSQRHGLTRDAAPSAAWSAWAERWPAWLDRPRLRPSESPSRSEKTRLTRLEGDPLNPLVTVSGGHDAGR